MHFAQLFHAQLFEMFHAFRNIYVYMYTIHVFIKIEIEILITLP